MKNRKILFVCTGNTCRSPMAEAAMRKELKRRKITGFTVRSAGLRANVGGAISPNSVQALTEAKIPLLKSFAPKQLTKKMITESYAVICMTSAQEHELYEFTNVTSYPSLCGKDISDPYGLDIGVYRVTLRQIREGLPKIITALRLEEISQQEKEK